MTLAKRKPVPLLSRDRRWRLRRVVAAYGVYIALAILLLAAAVLTPKLYAVDTIAVVMRQASQLGIVAIGQTLVLLVAGLDLSVGGIFIMTSVVVAEVGNGRNEMILPAILIALALGALVGLGNGLLVTKRRVPPFVGLWACWCWSRGRRKPGRAACRVASCQRRWASSISPGLCCPCRCFCGWA